MSEAHAEAIRRAGFGPVHQRGESRRFVLHHPARFFHAAKLRPGSFVR
jgi:hypothetical protein